MSVVVAAAAVALLLAAFSLEPVADARAGRGAARMPAPGPAASNGDVLIRNVSSSYEGEAVYAQEVTVVGRPGSLPAGLASYPGAGELAASPAMATLLDDPSSPMAVRYPGQVTQVVTPAGLVGPDELVVWIGLAEDRASPDAVAVSHFGSTPVTGLPLPAELRPAQALLVVGFLIPLLALLVTCSTIGGAQRDQRLSSLRLLGVTGDQVRVAAAIEAAVLAVCGVVCGVVSFWSLRPAVAVRVFVDGGVWPDDVPIDPVVVGSLLLLLPLLAATATVGALRSVVIDPLGVRRRAPAQRASNRRLIPLALGALLLGGAVLASAVLDDAVSLRSVLVLSGVGLVMIGLLVGSHRISSTCVAALERRRAGLPLPLELALRQVRHGGGRLARPVTGLACMVFISGLLFSFFPLLSESTASDRRVLATEYDSDLLVSTVPAGVEVDSSWLQAADGVRAHSVLRVLTAQSGPAGDPTGVLVGECQDLVSVFRLSSADCDQGIALGETPPAGVGLQVVRLAAQPDGQVVSEPVGEAFSLPGPMRASGFLTSVSHSYGLGASAALPTDALPADVAQQLSGAQGLLVVQPDGDDLELARSSAIRAVDGSPALTTGESLAIAERTTRTFRGLTLAAFVSAAAVATLALLVSTVDQVREDRRINATLWMIGVPRRTLRWTHLLRVAVTSVPPVLVAGALALVASRAFLDLADRPPPLPGGEMALVLVGALISPLVVALSMFPLVDTTKTRLSLE